VQAAANAPGGGSSALSADEQVHSLAGRVEPDRREEEQEEEEQEDVEKKMGRVQDQSDHQLLRARLTETQQAIFPGRRRRVFCCR